MDPMELKLSMKCCMAMAIDLSEITECSDIAAKKRDLHHLSDPFAPVKNGFSADTPHAHISFHFTHFACKHLNEVK
jgi:hypothetical protein